jgi:hypothetical protein
MTEIQGTFGDDTLLGTVDDDVIYARRGNDTVSGGAGNDVLIGGDDIDYGENTDNDSISGGIGDDEIYAGFGDDFIDGGLGNDYIVAGLGNDTILGGEGNDVISSGQHYSSFPSETPNSNFRNVIDGGVGNDTIHIGDFTPDSKSENQILFGRGDGADLVDMLPALITAESADTITIVFKSGLNPEDVELAIVPSQQLFADQDDIVFRVIDTGETLTLDADFGVFPEIINVRFEDGGIIDFGELDFEEIIDKTSNDQTVNLGDLLQGIVNPIQGTNNADNLSGTESNDVFISGGLSQGVESIRGNGGSDTLVLNNDDAHAENNANNSNGHYRIRDFVIDDTSTNDQADVLDIGSFLLGSNLDASNIGNYLHVVSGSFSHNRSSIFVDREGQFTDQDRANLTNGGSKGGNGSDLFLEFQGQTANNNLEELTGFKDNTVEQFQALIDLGFLDLSNANNHSVIGTPSGDGVNSGSGLMGREGEDDDIYSGGVGDGEVENVQGVGLDALQTNAQDARGTHENNINRSGNDRLIIDGDDAFANNASNGNGHIRVRGFTVDDVTSNENADSLVIGDLLRHDDNVAGFLGTAEDATRFLHFEQLSGNIVHLYIDRDGGFVDEESRVIADQGGAIAAEANYLIEFRTLTNSDDFNFTPNGSTLNSSAQIQALVDLGFLELGIDKPSVNDSEIIITGTDNGDTLIGSDRDDRILSGGLSSKGESIYGNGGADTLVLDADDAFSHNSAGNGNAHIRIKDFTIGDTSTNAEADTLEIGSFLSGADINFGNIGNYLHIESGAWGPHKSVIFIDKDGKFTADTIFSLERGLDNTNSGADIFLEFQGQETNNNFETITGFADNSLEQFQSLVELGFLDFGSLNRAQNYELTITVSDDEFQPDPSTLISKSDEDTDLPELPIVDLEPMTGPVLDFDDIISPIIETPIDAIPIDPPIVGFPGDAGLIPPVMWPPVVDPVPPVIELPVDPLLPIIDPVVDFI